MDIVDWGDLESYVDRCESSAALINGRIKTEEDVKRNYNKLKLSSFYLHLNPFNYLKKEKPLFWNLWDWSEIKYFLNPKLY